jgi:hypothetical protein
MDKPVLPWFNLFIRFTLLNSGRAARARKWDGETGYRLHVSPLNPRTSRQDIEKIFSKFGALNEVSDRALLELNEPVFLRPGLDGN